MKFNKVIHRIRITAYIAAIPALLVIAFTNVGRRKKSDGVHVPFGPLKAAGHYCLIRYHWCKELKYLSPPHPGSVALVSAPGSGNTWLRYLLQQTTGILTGSTESDPDLFYGGFPGDIITESSSVLVIKTHHPPTRISWNFSFAILLLRHPKDASLAEFHRSVGGKGHLGRASESQFNNTGYPEKKDWETYLQNYMRLHYIYYASWLTIFNGPLHIVFYDKLVKETRNTLRGILDFLNYTVTEEDIACALAYREGIYRRPHHNDSFDPFTPEMLSALDMLWKELLTLAEDYPYRTTSVSPLTPHTMSTDDIVDNKSDWSHIYYN